MKKSYEAAEIAIIMFTAKDVIVASGVVDVTTSTVKPSATLEDNETEIL